MTQYIRQQIYLIKEEKKGRVHYRKIVGQAAVDKWLALVHSNKIKGQIVSIEEQTTQVHYKMKGLF